MNRRNTFMAIAGTVGVLGLGGAGAASALSDTSSTSSSLAIRLVEKFNLNQSEVQAVLDEQKASRDARRPEHRSERLQDAVDAGDITAEQKKLIEDKQVELEELRDKQHNELEQWAADNDIDKKYLMGGMHMGHGRGM